MDVEPVQHEEGSLSDVAATRRGDFTCDMGDEHVSTAPPASNTHQQQHSIDLDAMDAVFHEIVMRRLYSPMGYKLLGKDQPPLVVHHSSFSDYVKSMRIVG